MLTEIFNHINPENLNSVLCIDGEFYSYEHLYSKSAQISGLIDNKFYNEKVIGVAFFNDITTFASIVSVWANGKTLVILDAEKDYEYNYNLIQKSKCRLVLSSSDIIYDSTDLSDIVEYVNTTALSNDYIEPLRFVINPNNEFYFSLNTNFNNINELIQYKWNDVAVSINTSSFFNFKFNSGDKFLSFFDFPHPLSIFTFLLSLKSGACYFTTPSKTNRAYAAYSIIDEYQITFSFITPYAIKQLEPFFEDISLWSLKYLLIVGDFLYNKYNSGILKCASNAYIYNVSYSPFIFGLFSAYEIENTDTIVAYDNVVTKGKPFDGFSVIILSPFNDELRPGEIGQIILKNNHVDYSSFYIHENELLDDEISNDFHIPFDNYLYKTETIGFINDEGMIIPVSTIHKQIIIENIPLNLSLLEKSTRKILQNEDVVSIIYTNMVGYDEIHLYIQNLSMSNNDLFMKLKSNLPEYLLPTQIHNINAIPINDNCFIDYASLYNMLKNAENSFGC